MLDGVAAGVTGMVLHPRSVWQCWSWSCWLVVGFWTASLDAPWSA